jgi:hypothetical protein
LAPTAGMNEAQNHGRISQAATSCNDQHRNIAGWVNHLLCPFAVVRNKSSSRAL